MSTPLSVLNLTIRAQYCLKRGRVYDVETLRAMEARDILSIPEVGKKTLQEINLALAEYESTTKPEGVGMNLREAAEMALEALETLWDILDDIDTASDMAKENDAWYRKRVEALQKKRWDTMITTDGYKLKGGPVEALRQALAQPEQKPVRWINFNAATGQESIDDYCDSELASIPLYTAPPKREWVGLTDEEVDECYYWKDRLWTTDELVRHVEAKLKEKNAGA